MLSSSFSECALQDVLEKSINVFVCRVQTEAVEGVVITGVEEPDATVSCAVMLGFLDSLLPKTHVLLNFGLENNKQCKVKKVRERSFNKN